MSTSFFTKGTNSTLVLNKGTNLAYQSTGLAIYTSTEIDRWPVGEFVSVEYIINAEFGKNERETIHATMVAMPGQTAITIYGRTNLSRPLVNVRASATNSYAQLIVEPASLDVQGSIVSFFGNYARSTTSLVPLNSPAIANSASWASVNNVNTLTINIPPASVTGTILLGQLISNSLLPSTSTVTAWNSTTGVLIISWLTATSISAASTQQLVFTTAPSEPVNNISIIQATQNFKSIESPGQVTIKATLPGDTLRLLGSSGIVITTDAVTKQINFANQAFTSVTVAGQTALNTAVTNSSVLNLVAGAGITLTTDSANNRLTLTGRAPTITTEDGLTLTGYNLTIAGGTGIVTSVVNGKISISSSTNVNSYSKFIDSTNSSSTAASQASSFKFRSGVGISAVVTANDATYGDNLLITNTGVTSVAGLGGNVSVDALVTAINTSAVSLNLAIGAITPSAGAFTTLSATGNISVNNVLTFQDNTVQNTAWPSTPSTKVANATGVAGQIAWDSNYIYICVATNTWKRSALTGSY